MMPCLYIHTYIYIYIHGIYIYIYIYIFIYSPFAPTEVIMTTTNTAEWNAVRDTGNGEQIHAHCSEVFVTRTGGRGNQPNKCVALSRVPEGSSSYVRNGHRMGETAKMINQYQNDYSRDYSRAEEMVLLAPLLERLEGVIKEFQDKLGDNMIKDKNSEKQVRKAAVVMVANEGVMDLLLNFICSAKSSGIDTSPFIAFVGREEYIPLVENMGIKVLNLCTITYIFMCMYVCMYLYMHECIYHSFNSTCPISFNIHMYDNIV